MSKLGFIHIRVVISAFIALFAILLILASWYYRDDLFQTIYDPAEPFQTYSPPTAPDYNTAQAWLARPEHAQTGLDTPGGDIFIVTPTLYLGGRHWNAPTQDPKLSFNFERIAIPNYISPYNIAGRVYAPSYRQAALYTFLNNRDDAAAAQKFAYQDVRRAFEVFLAENPPERPIVLVGDGQGGLHVQRLLQDYFNGDKSDTSGQNLTSKLAAAYVINHPQPIDDLGTLKPCKRKQNTNCVIAFGAFEPKEKKRAQMFVQKTLVWTKNGDLRAVSGRPLLCVNPLLWTQDTDYAPSRLHLGGVAAEGLDIETIPAPVPQQTGAQCQDGILILDKPKHKSLRRPSRFGGKYRTLPSSLFYEDLRVDAKRRVQYVIDKNVLPRRAPMLTMDTVEIEDSPVTVPLKPLKQ